MTGLAMMCPQGPVPKYVETGTISTVCKNDVCPDNVVIQTYPVGHYEWCNPENHVAIIVLAEIVGTACFMSLALSVLFGTES